MLDDSTESVGSKNFDLVSSKPFITTEIYICIYYIYIEIYIYIYTQCNLFLA